MQELCHTVAANLKRHRKALSMTQAALAEAIGYSEKAVSKWESGKGLPPTAILPSLAAVLRTTPTALLTTEAATQLFLGIDGGGTKTEFILADSEGTLLRRTVLGASNPNDVGISAMQEVLRQGIMEVASEYAPESISVFAGIAGGTTSDVAKKIHDFLSRFGFAAVGNGSDAQNAISAGLGTEDGVALIMGTGSVAFAQKSGTLHRIGGYGYLLGDAGSGYALGRDAILAALQQEDGSGEPTALHGLVLGKCGGEHVLPALGEFYRGGKTYIAQYAPLLFEAARGGDSVALSILKTQLKEIAKLIAGAAKRLQADTAKVVLCGGLATAHQDMILPLLKAYLAEGDVAYRLRICTCTMAEGALYLAGMKRKDELSC
ncbi:MAG: XRE family transcriptional regulator [Clostridia bacterium]|nr:XRE family transcriptional regulator [Clostridia bacterium]